MELRVSIYATLIAVSTFFGASSALVEGRQVEAIAGVVIDASSGETIPRADVRLIPGDKVVTSDDRGQFKFQDVAHGTYRIIAGRPGFQPVRGDAQGVSIAVVFGRSTTGIILRMTKEASISGRIVDISGGPVVGFATSIALFTRSYDEGGTMKLLPVFRDASRKEQMLARTDDRGDFRFFGLPPDDYYLRVLGGPVSSRPTLYYPSSTDESRASAIHVEAGAHVKLETLVVPEQRTTLAVLRFTEPTATLPVRRSVQIGSDVGLVGSAQAMGGAGRIILGTVAHGRHDVLVTWSSGDDLFYSDFELNVGDIPIEQAIQIEKAARILGSIVLSGSATNAEVSGVKCTLRSQGASVSKAGASGCIGGQYSRGEYELSLEGLPEDVYPLSATVSGHDVLVGGLDLTTDVNLHIVLAKSGATLSGTVRSMEGNPMPNAVVVLIPDTGLAIFHKVATTDVDGHFKIAGIRPGKYNALAWQDLRGAAYRNAEFMKSFEGSGKQIDVIEHAHQAIDLVLSDSLVSK